MCWEQDDHKESMITHTIHRARKVMAFAFVHSMKSMFSNLRENTLYGNKGGTGDKIRQAFSRTEV